MKKTARGFNIYSEFKDSHGSQITVVESSSATKHCVWLFTKWHDGKDVHTDNLGNQVVACPHLTKAQARRLAKALLRFAGEK